MRGLSLGPVRVIDRPPAMLWNGDTDAVVITTGALGFAGASEADRARLINAFRRLLDGLDAPLQVLIEVEPGTGAAAAGDDPVPSDFRRHAQRRPTVRRSGRTLTQRPSPIGFDGHDWPSGPAFGIRSSRDGHHLLYVGCYWSAGLRERAL